MEQSKTRFYLKEGNELSQAIANDTVQDYLSKVDLTRLSLEVIELVKYNVDIDKQYLSREDLALQFIHRFLDNNEVPLGKIVETAYSLADQVIAQRKNG